MIKSVKINDNSRLPVSYACELDSFKNGVEYNFNPGVNIIIGRNGCGKSTLIRLISQFMLCESTSVSQIPDQPLDWPDLFKSDFGENSTTLNDGADIVSDYLGVVYNYITHKDVDERAVMSSVENVSLYLHNAQSSTGETMISTLETLFDIAFSNKDIYFPLKKLFEMSKTSNDLWSKRMHALLQYYKRNMVLIPQEEFEFTFLLDEPDRNLDISNIEQMYEVLSYSKPYTQLICVLHNPILIYKLSKLEHVNFIEMTDGYLDEIKKVFSFI